jgi:hypothetical protein
VDCYAYGEGVYTTGVQDFLLPDPDADPPSDPPEPPDDINKRYTYNFDGTSAAAAIIAGLSILIEQMSDSQLSPVAVRQLLREHGTPISGLPANDPPRVMPDLEKIMLALGAGSDVFIRDSTEDDGSTPSVSVFASPDIAVGPAAPYAFPPPTRIPPGSQVLFPGPNHVYVRFRNRGAVDTEADADVYWSRLSTFVHPDAWQPVGTTEPVTVPAGGEAAPEPLVWQPIGPPPAIHTHASLLAVARSTGDPAPPMLPAMGWQQYSDYLRSNNNVAVRSVVVAQAPDTPDWELALPSCLLQGFPDRPGSFDFEVRHSLPRHVTVTLAVPASLTSVPGTIVTEPPYPVISLGGGFTVITVPPRGQIVVRGVPFLMGVSAEATIHVSTVLPVAAGPYWISITQRAHTSRESVGKVNWRLDVP